MTAHLLYHHSSNGTLNISYQLKSTDLGGKDHTKVMLLVPVFVEFPVVAVAFSHAVPSTNPENTTDAPVAALSQYSEGASPSTDQLNDKLSMG